MIQTIQFQLGNMWAQSWVNLYDRIKPFKNASVIDLTAALKRNNFTALKIFEESDRFYQSLGLESNKMSYTGPSIIEKPKDRLIVCHASAWVRIQWILFISNNILHTFFFCSTKNAINKLVWSIFVLCWLAHVNRSWCGNYFWFFFQTFFFSVDKVMLCCNFKWFFLFQ